jgi:hypothetical protein
MSAIGSKAEIVQPSLIPRFMRLKSFVAEDERLHANVPDAPAPAGGFRSARTSSLPARRKRPPTPSSSNAAPSAPGIF